MAEFEQTVKAFPIDENLPNEVAALEKEGWRHGATPVAVYILIRQKSAPVIGMQVEGKMILDESKILVVPSKKN